MLWELRSKNIPGSTWICFAPHFKILRPSILSITLTQPFWSLWIWNSLKGCRICPLMSTWTLFIKIPHFHQYCQHEKWSPLKIVPYSHYIKWNFLLPFCPTIYWVKRCSILFEIGINQNEIQPLWCGFDFDQISE